MALSTRPKKKLKKKIKKTLKLFTYLLISSLPFSKHYFVMRCLINGTQKKKKKKASTESVLDKLQSCAYTLYDYLHDVPRLLAV